MHPVIFHIQTLKFCSVISVPRHYEFPTNFPSISVCSLRMTEIFFPPHQSYILLYPYCFPTEPFLASFSSTQYYRLLDIRRDGKEISLRRKQSRGRKWKRRGKVKRRGTNWKERGTSRKEREDRKGYQGLWSTGRKSRRTGMETKISTEEEGRGRRTRKVKSTGTRQRPITLIARTVPGVSGLFHLQDFPVYQQVIIPG